MQSPRSRRLPGSVVYVESSSNVQPNLLGNYASFNVTNTSGSTISDAWVTIGGFTGSYVSLAPNEPADRAFGNDGRGSDQGRLFLFAGKLLVLQCGSMQCEHGATIHGGFIFGPAVFKPGHFTSFLGHRSRAIAAQSNTVNTVVTSSNDPDLGMLLTVTVTGSTGTIGSAKVFYETPEAYADFPANVFRLYSTSVTFSGGNTEHTNRLLIPSSAFTSTSSTAYSFVATYLVVGMKATTTAVSPVAFISSGNQIKHTDTSGYSSLPPIPPPTTRWRCQSWSIQQYGQPGALPLTP